MTTSTRPIARAAAVSARIAVRLDSLVVTDVGRTRRQLWRIRADGAGLAGRSPAGLPAHAGWEDAAVPPAMLGDYLRDFDALMDRLRRHRPALRSLR